MKILSVLFVILLFLFANQAEINAEWKQSSKGWWYSENSYYSIGWRFIDGKWYNFDNLGCMRTGWVKDGTLSYYMGSDGSMKTGFQFIDGITYKFGNSGKLIGKFIGMSRISDNGKEIKTFLWENGDKYEGEWSNNQINGQGKLIYINGNTYEGNFKDGMKNGQGIFIWKNGDKYEGQWSMDKMNGQGTYKFTNGNIINGIWKDNNCIKRIGGKL